MKLDTFRDLAKDYAVMFQVGPQQADENGAAFRERVARTLFAQGARSYAHEVLYNRRLGGDSFTHASLDLGYGEEFISRIAVITQSLLEETCQQQLMPSWKQKLYKLFG